MDTAGAAGLPAELVIPAEQNRNPNATRLVGAGATGYLWGVAGEGYNWTSYADGSTRPVPLPAAVRGDAQVAGTDVVTFVGGRRPVQRDMGTGEEWTLPIPSDQIYGGVYGRTIVTTEVVDGKVALHRLTREGDQVVDDVVPGLPEGATRLLVRGHEDAGGLFVEVGVGAKTVVYRLDASGLYPTALRGGVVTGSGEQVVQQSGGSDVLRVWNMADLSAPAHELTFPGLSRWEVDVLGVVGQDVLFRRISATGGSSNPAVADYTVLAVPVSGGPERVVMDRAAAIVAFEPDGTMLLGRAPENKNRLPSVYAIGAGTDGALSTPSRVADVADIPTVVEGMSIAQGRLHTIDRVPFATARLRRTDVSLSGGLAVSARTDRGLFNEYGGCDWDWCEEVQSTGDGRLAYQGINGTGLSVLDEGAALPARKINNDSTYQQPNDTMQASGRYSVVRIPGPESEDYSPRLRVIDLDTGKPVYTGPFQRNYMPAFTINGATLWFEGATAGVVDALDVRTGKALGRVDVGDCNIKDLRANSSDLYWVCETGASGVYGIATKKSVRLPAHRTAMLGDGYVGWEQAGVLSITDVRGGTGTRTVGKPANVVSGEGWTLDRFGGPLVYADKDGNTHVVSSGVPTTRLSVLDTDASASVNARSASWGPRWWLSKPAGSWQLTLRNRATGVTARTFTGGEARGTVGAAWDGRDAAGNLVANGAYDWTLSAKPADGQGAALAVSGAVKVTGGAAVTRDFVGNDGIGDLLAFTSAGVADFRAGTGTGLVDAKVSGSGWTGANSVTAAVPFGDVSGDRCNDVLVRVKSGELRAYKPSCGGALKSTTPFTKVGSGWNIYDVLTSPGDLTGDGRADVVARETATGYLYLYESTGAGAFKARVKIGTGWKGYLLAGAGDLNGDGKGDLMARDTAGALWRYAGTGKGTLAARVKVGSGWQVYNSLVGVGDVSGDGKADLLARDTAGVLWAYRGDGKGTFGYRTKVGGGWQMYKSLF
ncbi:FG-GAP-like repeat-containing protein [Streptomyces sp. NBC_01336]|uniref:FG-GAP-like repeat-containing protein n=1 Tax=Streptomyces sp. NBC_01336 TaxID=2903829 RepID=UPI002E1228DD|nr:FG-GAP-like repeat-containing protein [Streptomyces sp. NBC_01336]